MFVFDTDVLSEVMKNTPDTRVVAWLQTCPVDAMFTTAISLSEILYGVRRVADGSKRQRLERAAEHMFAEEFADRVLAFDSGAADAHADIRLARRQAGAPISAEDGMIAAIAKARGATVVTQDGRGFNGCGIPVVNPWQVG